MKMSREPQKLWIRDIDLWGPDECRRVNILILDKKVEKIVDSESAEPARFALIPSGVDCQVHLRVPGQEHKEDSETGLTAALCGGYGAILTMPNTQPTVDRVEVLKRVFDETKAASQKFGVHVYASAAITKELAGEVLVDLEGLIAAGAKAFTDDGKGVVCDELMRKAYETLELTQIPLLQHSEYPGHGGVLAPGPVQEKLGLKAYLDDPEIQMLERDLRLLQDFPQMKYHLLHTTSARAVGLISQYKQKGFKVTAEVSPHHLFFDVDGIDEKNTSFKMNPPIRSAEDKRVLREALVDGTFDFVATDHAPHHADEKGSNFESSFFGTLGLETALPVLFRFYKEGWLTAERLVQVFSSAPARFLGLDSSWGGIKEGNVLRAVVLDLEAPEKVYTEEQIHSKSKNSCFIGQKLPDCIVGHFTEAGFFRFKDNPFMVEEQGRG